jgi:phenol 2-monooxygenase
VRRYTAQGSDLDGVIDLRAVFQQSHHDLAVEKVHPLLKPAKGKFGLPDPEKVFCVDFETQDIFDVRGIDREKGCILVVRPDQYVAQVLPLDATAELAAFFDAFMLEPAAVKEKAIAE